MALDGRRRRLLASGLFDSAFYLAQNPDVAQSGKDAAWHYVQHGWTEGRQPHPLFDARYYLDRNPDVAIAKTDPLVHYLMHGAAERRDPSPFFDADYYLAQLPRPMAPGITPIQHYIEVGGPLGFAPSSHFDPQAFASRHPEASSQGTDLLAVCLRMYQGKVPEEFAVRDGSAMVPHGLFARTADAQAAAWPDGGTQVAPRVVGIVEKMSRAFVTGWAMDLQEKTSPVQLDLFIDNILLSSTETRIYRGDVKTAHGGDGLAGFCFELPPNFDNDEPVRIEVRSRLEPATIKNSLNTVKPVPNARRAPPSGKDGIYLGPRGNAHLGGPRHKKPLTRVAIIVLNLDGRDLLRAFFDTFQQFNSYRDCEILVVDHASSDDSRDVIMQYARMLPVRLLARPGNYSFSDSNNWAAMQTDAEILLFANNDIEFCQDVVAGIRYVLEDETVGISGIKLLDKPIAPRAVAAPTVQHVGVYFRSDVRDRVACAFEARATKQFAGALTRVVDVPSVTGSFLACRTEDFVLLGGFDPAYFYGYEDVDLCLRFQARLGMRVVCANHFTAIHHRGFTRNDPRTAAPPRTKQNWAVLDAKRGYWLRRRMAKDLFALPGYWTSLVPKIGFAVTDARDNAAAGDYFTALELAVELQRRCSCKAVFLEKDKLNWYDANGLDVLIVMRDDYDLGRLQNRSPRLITIGWARNWIDRWAERPWAQDYNAYWASSAKAANYLAKRLARSVEVVPIATSKAFLSDGVVKDDLKSDYCFTGSYWGVSRDIVELLNPEAFPFNFALFGYGWENHPDFAKYTRGGQPYSKMKDVYTSTRVVVDDANSATKQWGSVNSRVFDALAAGALVVTNGKDGADEIFAGLLPAYSSVEELQEVLTRYLTDEASRLALVEQLRRKVAEAHTYAHRAEAVNASLRRLSEQQLRFSIKIGAPSQSVREEWGDYHFASGIRRALTRLGHSVRIDCLDQWNRLDALGDDAVIVLRGLSKYETRPHQVNLLWNISHPDKVSDEEYESFDHVFVASERHAQTLARKLRVPVTALLQCTDPEIFHPDVPLQERHEVLFVGNSRKVFRRVVRDALDAGLQLSVFGTRWEDILPARHLKGTHIPNHQLAGYYASAGVVLNDHWDTMREYGFLSNRLFDAAACGARLVTDRIDGLKEVFGNFVSTYDTTKDLKTTVEGILAESVADREKRLTLARSVMAAHTFDARVECILQVVLQCDRQRTDISPEQPVAGHATASLAVR